jgi:hypothetical protein
MFGRHSSKLLVDGGILTDYPPHTEGLISTWEVNGHVYGVHSSGCYQVEIGVVPRESRDTLAIREAHGGRPLMVGYTRKRGLFARLLRRPGKLDRILLVQKDRYNLKGGELDYEIPEAFIGTDGTPKWDTVIYRGLTGTDFQPEADFEILSGRNFVGHRDYFVLLDEKDGAYVVAVELTEEQVKNTDNVDWLVLMTWQQAVNTTRDARSGMPIARLVANFGN